MFGRPSGGTSRSCGIRVATGDRRSLRRQRAFSEGLVHSMERGGPLPLRFVRLLRVVLLKGRDKLLQLILGKTPQISLWQIGSAALEG
jgi:hypothetical protein